MARSVQEQHSSEIEVDQHYRQAKEARKLAVLTEVIDNHKALDRSIKRFFREFVTAHKAGHPDLRHYNFKYFLLSGRNITIHFEFSDARENITPRYIMFPVVLLSLPSENAVRREAIAQRAIV